jgi:hypothetical protein
MLNWATPINAILATFVVIVGAWLIWGPFSVGWSLALASGVLLVLLWRGTTIGTIWAWSTLLLGVESLAWPITVMVQMRGASSQPSDQEMGLVLNAVLFGLFSSVFWISFAFGLFRREQHAGESAQEALPPPGAPQSRSRRKNARRS